MTVRKFAGFGVVALLAGAPLAHAADAAAPAAPAAPAPPASPASQAETERQLEAARQRLDQAAREVGELSSRLGAHFENRFVFGGPRPRAMLGVQILRGKEGEGAKVMAVSPGGPAEAAGILVGDRITAIDGKDLTREDDAGRELVRLVGDVEPDRKVKLRVVRDGKSRDVEVTPRPAPPGPVLALRDRDGRFAGPGVIDIRRDDRDGPDAGPERGSALAGMELATLSEQLGAYFGAKSGVLVVRAGHHDAWKLRDGDVIVAIDGREPTNAAHATRILRSYQRGEKLQLKVLRERKSQTLEVTLPGG